PAHGHLSARHRGGPVLAGGVHRLRPRAGHSFRGLAHVKWEETERLATCLVRRAGQYRGLSGAAAAMRRPHLRKRQKTLQQFLAWCVHGYTALGLVAAAGAAVSIVQGTPEGFHRAFLLLFLATLIDATDGTLARRVRVKEVLPGFDGRRLDDLIDFLTYTSLP